MVTLIMSVLMISLFFDAHYGKKSINRELENFAIRGIEPNQQTLERLNKAKRTFTMTQIMVYVFFAIHICYFGYKFLFVK